MGFFSWNCNECGHPMLSPYATNNVNSWMNDVVVIEHSGGILRGGYDGYGNVGKQEIRYGPWLDKDLCSNEPCCYHEACWEAAGKPSEYNPSESSDDQGFFFEDPEHNMEKPALQKKVKIKKFDSVKMSNGINALVLGVEKISNEYTGWVLISPINYDGRLIVLASSLTAVSKPAPLPIRIDYDKRNY